MLESPKYITQISEELDIPYTTTQQRVAELEWAELIKVEANVDESSKRAIRLIQLANFRIELSPRSIQSIVKGEERKALRVV